MVVPEQVLEGKYIYMYVVGNRTEWKKFVQVSEFINRTQGAYGARP